MKSLSSFLFCSRRPLARSRTESDQHCQYGDQDHVRLPSCNQWIGTEVGSTSSDYQSLPWQWSMSGLRRLALNGLRQSQYSATLESTMLQFSELSLVSLSVSMPTVSGCLYCSSSSWGSRGSLRASSLRRKRVSLWSVRWCYLRCNPSVDL